MRHGPWTIGEVMEATEMRKRGMTSYSIARCLDRTEASVKAVFRHRGVIVHPRYTSDEAEFLRDNYHKGTEYCSKRLNRSRGSIKMFVSKNRARLFGNASDDED